MRKPKAVAVDNNRGLSVAVVGATGMVGRTMLNVLEERAFPVRELLPVASARSVGSTVHFRGESVRVISLEEAVDRAPNVALFSAGGDISLAWAPRFAEVGTTVVDNSSAWRMSEAHKLVVPEVNGDVLGPDDLIIANPNCTTMQLVMVLKPLHDRWRITRGVVNTYQSVTGTGQAAVAQLEAERRGEDPHMVYPHPIDKNCLPHCDTFQENGYTREEMKVHHETKKIMGDPTIQLSCTAVRVPVVGGHSEAVYVEFAEDFDLAEVRSALEGFEGVVVQDDPDALVYPMPRHAHGKDDVFVGRIRRDLGNPRGLHLWIVADNLRKGAATNTVQIAEHLLRSGRWS
jgi:aspartate-semialdehyde dehydrogenase